MSEPNFIEPDPDQLDLEWVRQPKLYLKYAEKLADARHEMAEAKASIEITYAELERDIRAEPDEYGLAKVTEAAIKATIINQKPYKRAQKRFSNARHQVDLLEATVNALEHRKKALENLVTLYCYSYSAAPQVKGDARELTREFEKRAARERRR